MLKYCETCTSTDSVQQRVVIDLCIVTHRSVAGKPTRYSQTLICGRTSMTVIGETSTRTLFISSPRKSGFVLRIHDALLATTLSQNLEGYTSMAQSLRTYFLTEILILVLFAASYLKRLFRLLVIFAIVTYFNSGSPGYSHAFEQLLKNAAATCTYIILLLLGFTNCMGSLEWF